MYMTCTCTCMHSGTSLKSGQPLYKGLDAWSQGVLYTCKEIPLYMYTVEPLYNGVA